ncbi:hypothetical protein N0V90_007356 [Kalmusia sp. IMI 367209]|nr:hypothetical protein N0V90_007356 [Kalmusia sp. IMI 367209]
MLLDDPTVPDPKYLRLRESAPSDTIATLYPPHTRVYHSTSNRTLCTLAYAVTQRGARKILYELGIRDLSKGYDFALSDYCGGLVKRARTETGEEFQLSPIVCASVLSLAGCFSAQQLPPPTSYDTVLKSPINPNITISYKEPDPGTCTTTFTSQKQYTGYVELPPYTLAPYQQAYPINTFFWFFEARSNPETAPLTIWLNGGPGSSSMIGLFREAGPCEVVQLPDGSYGTQANVWGWDRSSNLLFFDQPTQVGLSYDQLVNVSMNLLTDEIIEPPRSPPQDLPPWSFLNGTLATGNGNNTQNSSVIAARAAWHFLQGFLSAFPQYNPGQHPNRTVTEPAGINLFTESYGGQYGPTFADFFEDQNERRRTGELPVNNTLEIKLASLGIINGIVDTLIQTPAMASFVFNNTYDVQGMTQTDYLNLLSNFKRPSGCQDLGNQCHARVTAGAFEGKNLDAETTSICAKASDACWYIQGKALQLSGRSPYDIRVTPPNSFPSYAYLEYLNSADVLQSIGAKVNFTESNPQVFQAFDQTGDDVRGTQIQELADLLARGVRVAFIYGDADIICNWIGGEAVSLAVARESPSHAAFPAAGYADIIANTSYVGGHVRQFGNLSFSRIFDAGHTVPSYQGETAFEVFSRIVEGDDIGMGRKVDLSTFGTQGPANSTRKNKVLPQPKNTCWIRAITDTCTEEQQQDMSRGLGIVKNGQWFAHSTDYTPPSSQVVSIGRPGKPPADEPTGSPRKERSTTASSVPLTGVFTATATPTPSSGASRLLFRVQTRQRRQVAPVAPPVAVSSGLGETASGVKRGLIGGIAAVGGLLLLELPPFDRRPSRRLSAPMEPIPEANSPRPSEDRRIGEHPDETNSIREQAPPLLVQRNADPSGPTPSKHPAEEPPVSRESSPKPVLSSRKSTPPPEQPASPNPAPNPQPKEPTPPEPVPTTPVQRSVSLPSEEKPSEAASPPEPAPLSEPDTSSDRKPSLLKRIRSGFQHDNDLKAKAHSLF